MSRASLAGRQMEPMRRAPNNSMQRTALRAAAEAGRSVTGGYSRRLPVNDGPIDDRLKKALEASEYLADPRGLRVRHDY